MKACPPIALQPAKDQDTKIGDKNRQSLIREQETERYKSLMVTKSDEIPRLEAKQARAEAELEIVLPRYVDLVHPTVCSELYDKLPRELRNMIYSYIATFTDDITVEHSTRGINGVPTSPFFDGDCSAHIWDKPWYFDPSIVGPDLAREMVELQYRKSIFCLNDDALIPRLLDEDRWKSGAIPRAHIRQIQLKILDEHEFEDEAAQTRLSGNIRLLSRLEPGSKISINLFNLMPASYDGSYLQGFGTQEQYDTSHLHRMRIHEELQVSTAVSKSPLQPARAHSIYAMLGPVIRVLKHHGHIVLFDGSYSDTVVQAQPTGLVGLKAI